MAPSTRRTKRKSFTVETEAQRRNRQRRERRGEPSKQPSKQAVEEPQPPVHARIPSPAACEENLNLALVIYVAPPGNQNQAPVVEEEEAVTAEEEAVPAEGEAVPAEGEAMPVEREAVPAETAEEEAVTAEEEAVRREEEAVMEEGGESEKGEEEGGGETENVPAELNEIPEVDEGRNHTVDAGEVSMGDYEAIPPRAMYFHPSQYHKKIKLSTRCFIYETLKIFKHLNPELSDKERMWFERHPQFKHIFHMPDDKNHKVQGMWMLLLHNVCVEKKNEAWFAVNGVPIRYGLREHALISGLNCRNYPLYWKEKGSMEFVEKHFGAGVTVRYADVKAKISEMQPSVNRLKMLVLYFLSSILCGQTKTGDDAPSVEPFILRAVDDLKFCRTFPWGRLSFDYMLGQIAHTMDHFKGEVKDNVSWPIPGFCIPMELLAFEAIPELAMKFRERVVGADESCPRMCKTKFKKGVMKGFPLSSIYEALGNTKHIQSLLVPAIGEEDLLHEITELEDDVDTHDVVVDSWMRSLRVGHEICFENMLEEDLAARTKGKEVVKETGKERVKGRVKERVKKATLEEPPQSSIENRMLELENKVDMVLQHLEEKMDMLAARVDQLIGKPTDAKKKGKKRARDQ